MKRLVALIMIITLLVVFPLKVYAVIPGEDSCASDKVLSKEELEDIAVSAFPEYAHKIRGEHHSTAESIELLRTVTNPEIVVLETRAISDTQVVTYQEYSNSAVFFIVRLMDSYTIHDSYGSNGTSFYLLDLHLTCSASEDTILITDISCALAPSKIAQIFDVGTPFEDILQTTPPITLNSCNLTWESGQSTPAYLEYYSQMEIEYLTETIQPVYIRLDVGPVTLSTSADFLTWSFLE